MPILSHWYDSTPKKSGRKRDSNPGSSALEADALPLGQRVVGYQKKVGGYQRKVGGYQKKVGGYQRKVGGYQRKVGGYQRKVGGYQRKVGGYQRKVGGYQRKVGGYQRKVGGYQRKDGGYQRKVGGYQRKVLFVVDVSVQWTAHRHWQTKLLEPWKVIQLNLPRQKSVKRPCYTHESCHPRFTSKAAMFYTLHVPHMAHT